MRTIFVFFFCIAFQWHVFAQNDTAILLTYLKTHATVFDLSDKPDSVINRLMDGKRLLIYGQGGSHQLTCNLTIPDKVVKSLSQINERKLKYYFIEWGRCVAYRQNLSLESGTISTFQVYGYKKQQDIFWNVYLSEVDSLKKFFDYNPPFHYVGIDFERDYSFYKATNNILKDVSVDNKWLNKCRDTSYYLHLAENDIYKQEKLFVKYYKQLQKEFYKDSNNISIAIGNDVKYNELKYIMTNENVKSRYENRNPPMARNIISTLKAEMQNDISLLSIGMAHSLLKYNYSVVSKLNKSPTLKGKILTMNLYCQDCHTVENIQNNDLLDHFMKHNEIRYFQMAAEGKGDLVLFDLTQLPKQFSYLKACGDLMLFAKNQN